MVQKWLGHAQGSRMTNLWLNTYEQIKTIHRHHRSADPRAFQLGRVSGSGLNYRHDLMREPWGHAQLTTTAIYANAVGEEEQSIAARMW